jgi:hypothetical protein
MQFPIRICFLGYESDSMCVGVHTFEGNSRSLPIQLLAQISMGQEPKYYLLAGWDGAEQDVTFEAV